MSRSSSESDIFDHEVDEVDDSEERIALEGLLEMAGGASSPPSKKMRSLETFPRDTPPSSQEEHYREEEKPSVRRRLFSEGVGALITLVSLEAHSLKVQVNIPLTSATTTFIVTKMKFLTAEGDSSRCIFDVPFNAEHRMVFGGKVAAIVGHVSLGADALQLIRSWISADRQRVIVVLQLTECPGGRQRQTSPSYVSFKDVKLCE